MLQRSADSRTRYPDLEWDRYCGLLDLETDQFSNIQEELLADQLQLLQNSDWSEKFLLGGTIRTPEEFREKVPLTTYDDYKNLLNPGSEHLLPAPPSFWLWNNSERT